MIRIQSRPLDKRCDFTYRRNRFRQEQEIDKKTTYNLSTYKLSSSTLNKPIQ